MSKVVTLTSTYDHRVIQGAESGEFLAEVHRLLVGEDGFYDSLFQSFAVPYEPRVGVATARRSTRRTAGPRRRCRCSSSSTSTACAVT